MGWICPNCSKANDDTYMNCVVCGMDRPASVEETDSDTCNVVFSDFEAFNVSVKKLFRPKTPEIEYFEDGEPCSESAAEPSTLSGEKREEVPEKTKKKKGSLFRSNFAKPWPEHSIKFDKAVIEEKGYVRSEQQELNGIKGYRFFKADGSSQFIRVEMVLIQKMAYRE